MAGLDEETAAPGAVEAELDGTRERLADLLDELDRRKDELLNVPRQLRRHLVPIAMGAGAVLAAVVTVIAAKIRKRRSRRRLVVRARNLREALARMSRDPRKVAKEQPNVAKKVLTAALSAAATMVAKRVAAQGLGKASGLRRRRLGDGRAAYEVTAQSR